MADNQGDFAPALANLVQQQTVNVNSQLVALKDIQKDGTTVDVAVRSKLNFITGTNTTLTVTDVAASDRVDVTIDIPVGPGTELDYAEITSSGTAITGNSTSYDGTKVKIEVWANAIVAPAGTNATVVVKKDGTSIGQVQVESGSASSLPCYVVCFDTPSAGSHTYSVTSSQNMICGAGGASTGLPAFIRVTKA